MVAQQRINYTQARDLEIQYEGVVYTVLSENQPELMMVKHVENIGDG